MKPRLWVGLAVALALSAAAPAYATHSTLDRISVDETTGFAEPNSSFAAATADGSRVFFAVASTIDRVNGAGVLYERSAGSTTLISADQDGAPHEVVFTDMSDDGDHVFFSTMDSLAGEDTDGLTDTYERFAGVTRLVTTGPTDPQTANHTSAALISDDGQHAFFNSPDPLVAEDTDASEDVYERIGDTVRLVSVRPDGTNGGAENPAGLIDITADGSAAFFITDESLVPADSDGARDLYRRAGGTTDMISDWDSIFTFLVSAVSSDGSRVIVQTRTQLVPADTDTVQDVYELSGGQRTLISTGSTGGSQAAVAAYAGSTPDVSAVWFTSADQLTPDDVDTGGDLYRRQGGTTTLISTGPGAGAVGSTVSYLGQVGNGARSYFGTFEQLVPEDTDAAFDIYERSNGTTSIISTGPSYAGESIRPQFRGVSADGSRIFFESAEGLVPDASSNSGFDYIYERFGAATYLVARDAWGPADTPFGGITPSGTTLYFNTTEDTGEDVNGFRDVYATGIGTYVRPRGATPFRIPLVPAYAVCSAPNSLHAPPLAIPSCNPPVRLASDVTIGGDNTPARSVGFVRLRVLTGASGPPDDSDLRLQLNLTNVMFSADRSDYIGSLRAKVLVRVTDNGIPSTTQQFPFPFDAPCDETPDSTAGSICNIVTTADSILPGSATEGLRSIWAIDQVRVADGGADGDPETEPNGEIAVQGFFVP